MNDELFDRWLYESESDSLDFKKEQYKFISATDIEKSELLKDIIAMANSWRRVEGYLIIGIEDKPDKPNILHGITDHIDDASIQQFINSKVNQTCEFAYSTFTRDCKTYGIIRVPLQKRPVYLVRDFGKLKANVVYVRRGSSTDEAKPDEISKMGLDQYTPSTKADVEIGFYDKSKRKMLGPEISIETTYYNVTDEIPDYSPSRQSYLSHLTPVRSDYYRDIVDYINFKSSFYPFHFAITNKGDREAVNLRVEIEILSDKVELLLDGDEVREPDPEILHHIITVQQSRYSSAYSIKYHNDKCTIYNGFDRLHAKRTLDLSGTIYFQVKESDTITGKAIVYFDGQSIPYAQEIKINIICNRIESSWKDVAKKFFEPRLPKE